MWTDVRFGNLQYILPKERRAYDNIPQWDTNSTIDYILVRRQSLRFVKDCNAIPGEAVATQHRPLILEMELEKPKKTRKRSKEKKIKWWNLKNEKFELKFITQVGETIKNNWDISTYEVVERDIVEIARR